MILFHSLLYADCIAQILISERLENRASKKMWLIRFYKPLTSLCVKGMAI